MCVKCVGRNACLLDIAQDKHSSQPFAFGASVEEVKCDIQAAQVAVVTVIDERAALLSAFYFQSHGHRFQSGYAFLNDFFGQS